MKESILDRAVQATRNDAPPRLDDATAQSMIDEALAQLTPDVKRNGEVDADISYSIGSVYALEGLHGDAFEWL